MAEQVDSFENLFTIETHPYVIKEYMSGTICLETVVILNKLVKFMDRADSVITETILWPDVSRKIRKYNTFVNININNMKKIVLRAFTK